METKQHILGLVLAELETWVVAGGEPSYRAGQILEWIYRKRVRAFSAMSNLSRSLRERLAESFAFAPLRVVRKTGSVDTTQKFLFALEDGNLIESVLIPASPSLYGSPADRKTLCVSTQVGCAYGCKFCASGLAGWTRHLTAAEIVDQVLQAEQQSGERVNNLVFMGMGEPLANYDNLLRALEILNAGWGVGIGARHITVSTSGLAPRIKQLADQPLQIRLAISLHGATDEIRQKIMPINRRYNVATLMAACSYFRERKKQRISFEYILIDQINDQIAAAEALAGLALRLDAKVNLIPYNHVEGLAWQRPGRGRQHAFLHVLRGRGVDATIRKEKGHDIDAACGQLRLRQQSEAGISVDGGRLTVIGDR
jgi:23S rRNA (adenine2503-C2)-methyltransferase